MLSFTNLICGSGTRDSWSIDLALVRSLMSLTELKFSVWVLRVVIGADGSNKLWLGSGVWLIALSTGGGWSWTKAEFFEAGSKGDPAGSKGDPVFGPLGRFGLSLTKWVSRRSSGCAVITRGSRTWSELLLYTTRLDKISSCCKSTIKLLSLGVIEWKSLSVWDWLTLLAIFWALLDPEICCSSSRIESGIRLWEALNFWKNSLQQVWRFLMGHR